LAWLRGRLLISYVLRGRAKIGENKINQAQIHILPTTNLIYHTSSWVILFKFISFQKSFLMIPDSLTYCISEILTSKDCPPSVNSGLKSFYDNIKNKLVKQIFSLFG
jgi:hypothetical protein